MPASFLDQHDVVHILIERIPTDVSTGLLRLSILCHFLTPSKNIITLRYKRGWFLRSERTSR